MLKQNKRKNSNQTRLKHLEDTSVSKKINLIKNREYTLLEMHMCSHTLQNVDVQPIGLLLTHSWEVLQLAISIYVKIDYSNIRY